MIFLVYIIFGIPLLALAFILLYKRSRSAAFKNDVMNSLTIAHAALYLVFTIFILIRYALPVYGLKNYLFIDPLAMYEALIAETVFLLSAIYGRGYIRSLVERQEVKGESLELFYAAFNLLLMAVIFAFFSNNLALFWILLELTTIFSAVLIVMLRSRDNILAALKYVFISSTAMLFSVVGLIILFAITQKDFGSGTVNWSGLMQNASLLTPSLFVFAFTFIFIGFASKAGIAPFHTWLPQAHAKAPSVVSAILSAVVCNGGIYGIIRIYAIAHKTASWHTISIILLVFGAISIAIAALSLLPRTNLKKVIGFSTVENMGLVLIGIGIGTPVAIFWTLFHILAHSIIKSLLFFCSGILHHQYDSNYMQKFFNALKIQPLATWGVIIGSLAVIGIPPFPMFFSKLFILTQIANSSIPLFVIVLLLLVIVAAAFTFLLIRSLAQESDKKFEPYDAHWTMKLAIAALLVATIGTGFSLSSGLGQGLTAITTSLGF